MDIYLIFKNSSHRIVTDPTDVIMENAEVLFRRLNVGCRANMAIIEMMKIAVMDIISRLAETEMLPDRVLEYQERVAAFSQFIPVEIKISWDVYQEQGLATLTSQKAVPQIA